MPKKTEIDHYSDKEALDFHVKGKSGKIEISSSKPLTTKRDLSLAYSPGVAAPVKEIAKNYHQFPHYPAPNGKVKLAAGWLIEQAGWKGKTFGNFGVHKLQALVLVNYSESKGDEIYDLSTRIITSVKEQFGITLEREVNII